MRGKYRVVVKNKRLHYEFEIKRNITIIKGDSATGKTTLINMIRQFANLGNSSGVDLMCDVPCRTLEGADWKIILRNISGNILFIDEENTFIRSEEFASEIKESDNYFVIITRENLYNLPYSVEEIYGLHSSGKYQNTKQIYQQMYRIYTDTAQIPVEPQTIVVEDSNSGYEFFKSIAEEQKISCRSAGGKTKLYSVLKKSNMDEEICVVADVKEIKANIENITSLMVSNVNDDRMALAQQVEDTLKRLVRQTLVQKKLMTEKRVKANEKQKKSVRTVMKELFNVTSASDDDDAIMRSFLGYASNLKNDLEKLDIHYATQTAYPGKQLIASGKKLMADVLQMKYSNEFFAGIDRKKDDFLDFAEDYEPVKKFFAGEQKGIFDKALKLMKIYDDSKTFIVNSEIESVVADIKSILKKSVPYSEIFKLPDLLDKFINLYSGLLNEMQKPLDTAIQEARQRVFEELQDKKCHDKLADKYVNLFREISDKAMSCNNVATLQNIKVEADVLKVRCLNEIEKEEAKIIAAEQPAHVAETGNYGGETIAPAVPAPKVKRKKTVSIKSINNAATWQLENEADVKKYIAELEKKLMNTLEEDTIINIEF